MPIVFVSRFSSFFAVVLLCAAAVPAQAQVVETTPASPVRTDESVTITFHADRGTQGLEDCNCDVYAHTGLNTSAGTWRYVMDEWPDNRPKTKLTKVADSANTYQLTIPDIRAYYSDNNTGYGDVPPESEEEIQELAFVFRNADGSEEGKAEGGGDLFVEVNDVQDTTPALSLTLRSPDADPPFNPFIAATDTTVDVSVAADTNNLDTFDGLRLLVDGEPVDSTTTPSLTHPLSLTDPGRFRIRAEAEASVGDSTLIDTVGTALIRAPDVVDEPRPPGVRDGITYNDDGSVTLSLFAPKKDFVYAIGDFSDWTIDNTYFLKREKTANGAHWWGTIDGLDSQAQHDFQYLVDGEIRVPDPFAHKLRTPVDDQISEAVYPGLQPYPGDKTRGLVSVIRPDAQQNEFSFSDFDPPPQEDLVIYELLLRDFVEENSFRVLTDTLDYLDRLGVNAIELLPVTNFEGHNFWGYRPNSHLAMDKSYGPPEDLKRFVEAAHSRGIAVILDVVYNHITANSAIARLYDSAGENPFLESGPNRGICGVFFQELNQGSPFIKRYINRANRYWIEEFNIDGFRFDVAHCVADNGVHINEGGHNDALRRGWKALADSVWSVDPDAYVTLEMFGAAGVANDLGGYGGGGNTGGVLSWNKMSERYSRADMAKLDDGSNLSASYFGNRSNYDQPSGVTYMTSHDEQWLMRRKKAEGNGTATYSTQELETALDRQKLVGAFFFTVPGPRMMWQFGEVGYGWGPDECLRAFGGSDNCPPSAPRRIGPKPVRWDYADPEQSPERVELYKTWKALIHLRNDNDLFSRARTGSGEAIEMKVADGDRVRCLRLEDENLDATVVGNFGLSVQTATLEAGGQSACSFSQTGIWHNVFENDTLEVDSPRRLQLRPGEFRIYTSKEQPAPPMGLVPSAPVHRARASVSGEGTVDFGQTGVDINFQGANGGPSTITVEKLDERPLNVGDIGESNASAYRFVIENQGDLNVGNQTEVRFDVSTLDGVSNADTVAVYSRPTEDTGSFARLATSYDAETNELVAKTGSFSEFVLASDTDGLPVKLTAFDAALTAAQTVRLSWQTASETSNAGFQVQRAGTDGWTTIDFVEGAGTTDEAQSYSAIDEVPFTADSVRYRLKQVDADGSAHLSDAVTVTVEPPQAFTLQAPFPNPVRERATVRYAVPERQDVSLVLFDVLGRRVRTLTRGPQEGRQEHQLDVSALSSGTYLLRLRGEEGVETQRITVVK